jgi:hypothetical protein
MFNELSYFTSFDDHIDRIDNQIKETEKFIEESKTEIESLREERERVIKEKEEFNKDDYQPSFSFSDNEMKEHPEFCKKALQLIKAHEIMYHPKLVGSFYDHSVPAIYYRKNEPNPEYLFIGRTHNKWELKYIMCLDCYNKYIKGEKSGSTHSHYLMPIDTEIGSSQN